MSFIKCVALVLFACLVSTAGAGIVQLGGGWQASWDPTLDPYVDINPVLVTEDAIFFQKSAEFTQGPVNGLFPTIPIAFQQIGPSTISHFVIEDEIITNSTGVPWTDFHFDLLDHNEVVFDPARSAVSGGPGPIGFSIAPFMQAVFSTPQRLDIFDGVVEDGQVWFPGDGAFDGELWINVVSAPDLSADTRGAMFVLKETPTPEPASMLLLLAGGGAMLAKRRRVA